MRRGYYKKPSVRKTPRTIMNEEIRVPQVRVIDDEGNQMGLMTPAEAIVLARQSEQDLVEVAPLAKPPVCKIMDFGKYQYQQSKQDRLNKAKQKKVEIKEVRIGLRTDIHDLAFKKSQVEKFLKKGQKVKIEINLKGREKAHRDLAWQNLTDFIKSISIPYQIEQEIKKYPGGFNIFIIP